MYHKRIYEMIVDENQCYYSFFFLNKNYLIKILLLRVSISIALKHFDKNYYTAFD